MLSVELKNYTMDRIEFRIFKIFLKYIMVTEAVTKIWWPCL